MALSISRPSGPRRQILGRPDRAKPLCKQTLGIDLTAPPGLEFGVGHANLLMRRCDEAITAFLRVLHRVPRFIPARVQLARACGELDRLSEAREVTEVLRKVAPRYTIRSAHRM